jgi:methyltransferase (TIGR00027 family)
MRQGEFSRTALGAAGHRAAHQALEDGRIFVDPLAFGILGADAPKAIEKARAHPERRGLRLFIALRSRFAEDSAHDAIRRGVRQIVALGAGLDTFAYRIAPTPGLVVFEVDNPATQREKRRRLAAAGIAEPAHVVYVGCDFEVGRLSDALAAAGFDAARPSFVYWLGVTVYLTPEAVFATLATVAAPPGGAEIVFDYVVPPEAIVDPASREARAALAARVAASGEPLRAAFDPATLQARLRALGFTVIEDLGFGEAAARYAPEQAPKRRGGGARLMRAATAAPSLKCASSTGSTSGK